MEKFFAEYMFIKYFRENNSNKFLELKGQEILEKIKNSKDQSYLYQVISIILN